jgi:hypothetical protein
MPALNPPESFAFRVGRLLAQDGVDRGVTNDLEPSLSQDQQRTGQSPLRDAELKRDSATIVDAEIMGGCPIPGRSAESQRVCHGMFQNLNLPALDLTSVGAFSEC